MSEAPVQPDKARHVVDAIPVEARLFQGQRAGVVTRTAANAVDFTVAVLLVAAGYLACADALFVIDAPGFSFPTPSFPFPLAGGGALCCSPTSPPPWPRPGARTATTRWACGSSTTAASGACGWCGHPGRALPRLPDRAELGGRQHDEPVAAGHRAANLGDLRTGRHSYHQCPSVRYPSSGGDGQLRLGAATSAPSHTWDAQPVDERRACGRSCAQRASIVAVTALAVEASAGRARGTSPCPPPRSRARTGRTRGRAGPSPGVVAPSMPATNASSSTRSTCTRARCSTCGWAAL